MKYGYYPGCSLHSTGKEYEISLKAVCERLGIELQEIPGWICCGTSPAHSASRLLALALPLENLRLAEKTGLTELVAPCAACFARLKVAHHESSTHPELAEQLSQVLDGPLPTSVTVLHPLEILSNGAEIRGAVERKLPGLRVVCYYGCLLTRPPRAMQFDECEYPIGALVLSETDVALKLTRDILEEAKAEGANAIAVACPLCHTTLDMRQAEIEQEYEASYGLPVFYFTQLMALAFGIPAERLGIHKHFVAAEELLSATSA